MSLLFTYVSPRVCAMVSDQRVSGGQSAYDKFPKFQIMRANSGRPIFIGAVGLHPPIHKLFSSTPAMLCATGLELPELQKFLPGAINHMLAKRPPGMIDRKRDVVFPPVQMLLAGFDADTKRLRAWLTLATGHGPGGITMVWRQSTSHSPAWQLGLAGACDIRRRDIGSKIFCLSIARISVEHDLCELPN